MKCVEVCGDNHSNSQHIGGKASKVPCDQVGSLWTEDGFVHIEYWSSGGIVSI